MTHADPFRRETMGSGRLPGLILCLLLALAAIRLGQLPWLAAHGFGTLTLAIVIGMLLGNTVYGRVARFAGEGVAVSRQTLLRAGVVLYGLRLTVQDIAHVGVAGVAIDALVLASTFGLACLLGLRMLKLDLETTVLIGAGSAICGAAAVLATEPVLEARSENVTVAVATVVVFGTLAMFAYPALYTLNLHWGFVPAGMDAFGVYAGSTIHEVAQVVTAAKSVGAQAADVAVIAKMVRVIMLAPFLIALSLWLARAPLRAGGPRPTAAATKPAVPWFAVAFVGVVIVHSLVPLPAWAVDASNTVDLLLLCMAMTALGLTTHVCAIRCAGPKPLLLAFLLFVWLVAGGAAINTAVHSLLG